MGLIMTTRGWTGAAIEFTHSSGSDTFTPTDQGFLGDVANPYDVAVSLRAWLADHPSRPWSGTEVASVTLTVADNGRRHRFAYTYTGTDTAFTITPTAAWIACFGDTSQAPPTGARGTLAKQFANVNWYRRDRQAGTSTREGSWRMDHQTLLARRPVVSDRLSALEVHLLAEAQQYAAQPREAYVYATLEGESAGWRLVTLGDIRVGDVDDDALRFDVEIDVIEQANNATWSGSGAA